MRAHAPTNTDLPLHRSRTPYRHPWCLLLITIDGSEPHLCLAANGLFEQITPLDQRHTQFQQMNRRATPLTIIFEIARLRDVKWLGKVRRWSGKYAAHSLALH